MINLSDPPPKKISKQPRIFVYFKPTCDESGPNLVAEGEKSNEAVRCSGSNWGRPTTSEDQCPDTSAAFVEDENRGQDQEINYTPVDEIWNDEQKQSFSDSNKWLLIENGKLGCALCKQFDSLWPYIKKGQHVNKDWASCQIAVIVEKRGQK